MKGFVESCDEYLTFKNGGAVVDMVSDEFFAPIDADEPARDDEGFSGPTVAVDPTADRPRAGSPPHPG